MTEFVETNDRERFKAEARKNKREWNLGDFYFFDAYEEAVHPVRIFVTPDWTCGGVLAGKQLAMCYNNGPKGQGADCLFERIKHGGRWLNADDGFLTRHYGLLGFTEVCRGKFSPEFFPSRWDEQKHGTPDVVFMAYNLADSVPRRHTYVRTWNEAVILMESVT